MATQSTTNDLETTKPAISEARFWYSVFEATDAAGKLDYNKLAEIAEYKNGKSAKAVFFGKRKHMRALYGAKGDDSAKQEKEQGKVEAGVKKRGRKKKEEKKKEEKKKEKDGDTQEKEKDGDTQEKEK